MAKKQEAPGRLETVRAFVNTRDLDLGTDVLDSTDALRRWLVDRDLLSASIRGPSAAEHRRALDLREALRELLLANNDGTVSASAHAALNIVGSRARYALRFGAGGPALQADAPGVDGALGRILGFVHEALRDGTWERLKACRESSCTWAFYDTSKNRSAAWCSMEVCGNRNKVRLFRTRSRAGAISE